MSWRAPLALAMTLAGCASTPPAPREPAPEYPGVLHPPSELSPDFAVEQHIEVRQGEHRGAFDAVLQKRGDELVLVGLGPMGVRAFVLRQEGDAVRFEQTLGPKLPFPPRNVLVDVHRAFFKRLPLAGLSPPEGTIHGALDDEEMTETWRGGELVERSYARPSFRPGRVRVVYGPGCTPERCAPDTVKISNEWFGYELVIENRRYHSLQKS